MLKSLFIHELKQGNEYDLLYPFIDAEALTIEISYITKCKIYRKKEKEVFIIYGFDKNRNSYKNYGRITINNLQNREYCIRYTL